MRVQHKSIIVTGAGNGIGEGIAKRLAAEGGKVIVNDINEAGGQRVVAGSMGAGGPAAISMAAVRQGHLLQGRHDAIGRGQGPGR